ncbi:MAG: T9SS type A sorting domain-containing protein [Chitinophaga sp.]|uniref:T9SS type A sorting domain-containing protein n=1 Tax=Chitinophaga sp. TaxID=1869181 RepID=UPI0025C39FF5|nr:T9SS type A sorting domain-containing protein [Chitinophaga sp.]MBV8253024.1 T9SS type A sorting domain-containing protein [Chitinophaga sp.]
MKKMFFITIAGVLLHVASAHAAAHSCRQGIDSVLERNRILKVYPVPLGAQCTIEGIRSMKQLALYSIAGQLIKTWQGGGKRVLLTAADLSSGTYLLRVSFDDGTCVSKLILKQ